VRSVTEHEILLYKNWSHGRRRKVWEMQTTKVERVSNDERERIEALVTREQKDLLEQAAVRRGLPLADFISEILERAAAEAMRGDGVIVLGAEDSAAFAEALLNPPEPGPVLRAMARRYGLTRGSEESAL